MNSQCDSQHNNPYIIRYNARNILKFLVQMAFRDLFCTCCIIIDIFNNINIIIMSILLLLSSIILAGLSVNTYIVIRSYVRFSSSWIKRVMGYQ
jgi:hypothetical protein